MKAHHAGQLGRELAVAQARRSQAGVREHDRVAGDAVHDLEGEGDRPGGLRMTDLHPAPQEQLRQALREEAVQPRSPPGELRFRAGASVESEGAQETPPRPAGVDKPGHQLLDDGGGGSPGPSWRGQELGPGGPADLEQPLIQLVEQRLLAREPRVEGAHGGARAAHQPGYRGLLEATLGQQLGGGRQQAVEGGPAAGLAWRADLPLALPGLAWRPHPHRRIRILVLFQGLSRGRSGPHFGVKVRRSSIPSCFSTPATSFTVLSKPPSPNRRCSSASNCSPSSWTSFAPATW
jgi:hypothetical protein